MSTFVVFFLSFKTYNMKAILFSCVLFFVLNGCSSTKTAQTATSIEDTYWVLTELMGKPVSAKQPNGKEIHILLNKAENRVQGFAGCNGFGGNYELKAGNRVVFSQMIGTLMACDALDTENELLKALRTADNYTIADGKLSLNKARMAPLARFEIGKKK